MKQGKIICDKKYHSTATNKMAVEEEKLAEAVRKYTVLYDKSDKFFKDRNKKLLAWADVAKEANFTNGKRV